MANFLEGLFRKLRGTARAEPQPEPAAETPAPVAPPPPDWMPLIDRLIHEVLPTGHGGLIGEVAPKNYPSSRALLALDREQQADVVIEVLHRLGRPMERSSGYEYNRQVLMGLASALLRRKLPYGPDRIGALAQAAARSWRASDWNYPMAALLSTFENYAEENGIEADLRSALGSLAEALRALQMGAEHRRYLQRLEALLAGKGEASSLPEPGEAWADELVAAVGAAPPQAMGPWHDLLAHCRTATSAKPAEKWQRQADKVLARIGHEEAARVLATVLSRIGTPANRPIIGLYSRPVDPTLIDDRHADLLRGLAWSAGRLCDPALIHALGQAAEACFKKITNIGPRNVRVGNACLHALSHSPDLAAIAQLSRLKLKVRHASTRQQIEKTLDEAARRQGVAAADLEEMVVPDFGLEEVGLRRQVLGDFTAEIVASGVHAVELRWRRTGGGEQKSVPAAVRSGHATELKALQLAVKEIQTMLPAQRDRIERLYLAGRDWDFPTWRQRYLDHPLVGVLARKLIWRFRQGEEERLGIWHGGEIVDVEGTPLAGLEEGTRVSLWHPLDSPTGTVRAWRGRLFDHEVTQPFKQAHREIYVLTDAEIQTGTYSNRFAAHILKQHQFAALCQQRGWRYSLMGAWDSHNTPHRLLPEHDLQVEYWVGPAGNQDDITDAGIFLHIATDQVRFCDLAGEPRPLHEIPPLLFSELMRDVDLFVGVASVGNDPAWTDGGQENAYWSQVSFGELSATAHTRREVLERLLPRLKIAGRCTLGDRFLTVRGDRRTYKIHLGSSNILMEPNDQYLCIVPDRSSASRAKGAPVLPFEGDSVLGVILSKAFLLAEDTKITDRTILTQIGRG